MFNEFGGAGRTLRFGNHLATVIETVARWGIYHSTCVFMPFFVFWYKTLKSLFERAIRK